VPAHALFHVAPGRVECREVALRAPGPGEVEVRALYSAISTGTETMIYAGRFPRDAALDASIPALQGGFAYPFAYGYTLVGRVHALGEGVDPRWQDALVFVFHPHQDRIVVAVSDCERIPARIEPAAALYLPQVETALTLVLDGAPRIGERVAVFGLGLVGLLVARLLAGFPLARLVGCEPIEWRRRQAQACGIETLDSGAKESAQALAQLDADLAYELSGDMAALNCAIDATGFDGRIVIGSWYGMQNVALDLGGRFHRNRLKLVSSQVSTLAPALTGRWDKRRRLDLAWNALARLQPQQLGRRVFPLVRCAEAFETACARAEGVMQVAFCYEAQDQAGAAHE
jgi:2-desacetyl-2-hydroxyethyl bacteriochlorophyllide A dehydrogenase